MHAELGSDTRAGEVVEVGARVDHHAVGDRVYGMVPASRGGAYADYLAVSLHELAPMPKNLSYGEAAALPLVSLTAHQLLERVGPAVRRPRMVVNGCSGGLGHVALQMAKARGFETVAVCSTRNLDFARSLGADEVVDYTAGDVLTRMGRCDVFLDAANALSYGRVRRHLEPRGAYVAVIPGPGNLLLAPLLNLVRARKHLSLWVTPDRAALMEVTSLVEQGRLTPTIQQRFPLEQIRQAHELSRTGRVVGKLVLEL